MNIGFDAKRAFQNSTGLGHYSRTLISSLATYFPDDNYFLFAPKITEQFNTQPFKNIHSIAPSTFPSSLLKSIWRSNWVKKDLVKNNIDIYHGLSHEIPLGIEKTNIKSVVTIHDLIFERYPHQYSKIDVQIYRKKFRYACQNANKIIAISQQTKQDVIDFYKIDAAKIEVCYQSCNPIFFNTIGEEEKKRIKKLYNLPPQFYLYVGSVIERKNLLTLCKAIKEINNGIPLVVIGSGDGYMQKVKLFIAANNLQQQVIFLSEDEATKNLAGFKNSTDFPAIYQCATALIYPSIFEGFGIPILEALASNVPVITSNVSCMPETAGNAALYVNPYDVDELANALNKITTDIFVREDLIAKGQQHAQQFTQQKCAAAVMEVYRGLVV
jgi:glycosyltransferase involved in cell wall biosynthesis